MAVLYRAEVCNLLILNIKKRQNINVLSPSEIKNVEMKTIHGTVHR
jgi:hypothetical protein